MPDKALTGPKRISESDLKALSWYGIKPLLRRFITAPIVNIPLVEIVKWLDPAWKTRIPVASRRAGFRTSSGDTVFLLEPSIDHVAREFFWHQGRPASHSDRLVFSALEVVAADSDIFLDIGSYTGLFALVAASVNPGLRAHAFEIVPDNYQLIVRNIIENDLVERVEAHLCGLGREPGFLCMPRNQSLASLPSSLSLGSLFNEGIRIPVKNLDTLFPDGNDRVAIKIDVEGFEPEVFTGGIALLERCRPDMFCEILQGQGKDLQSLLEPLGYRFWRFTNKGLLECKDLTGVRGERDWLFSARKDAESLVSAVHRHAE